MAAKKRRRVGRGTKRHSATAVPVMFRIESGEGGDALAVFPTLDEGRGMVQMYSHVGQHSSGQMAYVRQKTRPAKPSEYASLKRELESAPYDYELRVVKRASRTMRSPKGG